MTGEFDIIERYFAPLSGPEGLALKDDAACIPAQDGFDTIVTKDVLVACTHFFETDEAEDIAFKALSVNVSDLVAKGAKPAFYFVGLSLARAVTEEWIAGFSKGLAAAQAEYGISLTGGDTTKTPGPVTVSITAIGYVPRGAMVKRSSASSKDLVYVTGFLGKSTAALRLLENGKEPQSALKTAYLRPRARLDCVDIVRDYATASADISDGILADLGHICAGSGVGAVVRQASLPVCDDTTTVVKELGLTAESVWSGGDDYELVFTVSPEREADMLKATTQLGLAFFKVGEIKTGNSVEVVDQKGNLVQVSTIGYQHFR